MTSAPANGTRLTQMLEHWKAQHPNRGWAMGYDPERRGLEVELRCGERQYKLLIPESEVVLYKEPVGFTCKRVAALMDLAQFRGVYTP